MKKYNILYDTNAIIYLFEFKENNITNKKIEMQNLYNLANDNYGFVTSVTLYEILYKCLCQNRFNWENCKVEFNKYLIFLNRLFINKKWLINDSIQNIDINQLFTCEEFVVKEMFDKKIQGEVEFLYRIIINIGISVQNCFEDILGRKVQLDYYLAVTKENGTMLRRKLYDVCNRRHVKELTNEEVDKEIDRIIFEYLSFNLKVLASNYSIPQKKIDALEENEKAKFYALLQHVVKPYDENYRKNLIKKIQLLKEKNPNKDDNEIFQIITKELNQKGKNLKYDDISDFIKKFDKDKGMSIDGEQAVFLQLFDSPACKFIQVPESMNGCGAQYVVWLIAKYKKRLKKDILSRIYNELNGFFQWYRNNYEYTYSEGSEKYFKFFLQQFIEKGRKISKNDANDYLIASAAECSQELVIITFDKLMKEFLKQENRYYNEELYSYVEKRIV
ncbi:MAG: hypothetical protein CVU92_01190 [Firmicutes bacterium HGW-Firmicutes-17]|jgi:rRNA-processing protein FCF1|nr:MAG: hypothetical protein CVU92_01190 [Firmicutes bacterium HGW-Firmicutes-17]